jgi:PAS domain S-box-containing protein
VRESRNQTILIVDSLNQISVSRKQLLKKNGYEISIARSEKETITRIKERSDIDLALTAIDLRENPKSLLVLGEILKKRNIPLVLISDHKDSDIRERMESVTHYGFIPIDSGDFAFLSTLKTAIDFANTKKELAEHKEFQHKILASQRIILDNAAAGIFVVHKGMILLANRKVPEISGYSMEELLSGELFEFIHPDDREMVKKYHYREEDKVEESHTLTCRIILKTGEIRWVEFYFTGIEWEHKRADLCLAYDVTEHKKIEEDHRLKSMILEQIKDYVTITNLEGQITYVNEAEAKMLGLSRDQIIGEKPMFTVKMISGVLLKKKYWILL